MALLNVKNLYKEFPIFRGLFKRQTGSVFALNGVDLTIEPKQLIAVVGESGCGKSTLAKVIMRLIEPTSGSIEFQGVDFLKLNEIELALERRKIQMVFQDPYSSLDPRKKIREALIEPLQYHEPKLDKEAYLMRASQVLEQIGLPQSALDKYPHQFSGGQQQRIAIGRAIILRPKLVILDEALSSLDVSYQAQIAKLLIDLRETLGLSYLFITHDLRIVRSLADRTTVLYMGKVMEEAATSDLFAHPRHPYTQALLSAIPKETPWEESKPFKIYGEAPSQKEKIEGCPFRTRCPYAKPICAQEVPKKQIIDKSGTVHTWFCIYDEL